MVANDVAFSERSQIQSPLQRGFSGGGCVEFRCEFVRFFALSIDSKSSLERKTPRGVRSSHNVNRTDKASTCLVVSFVDPARWCVLSRILVAAEIPATVFSSIQIIAMYFFAVVRAGVLRSVVPTLFGKRRLRTLDGDSPDRVAIRLTEF